MRRMLCLMLCICFLMLPAEAAQDEKLVALTFDDGPSGRFTRKLLRGLEERDARATFLLCGYRMEQYPALTEQILEQGHEIGLHGYSHKPLGDLCLRDIARELEMTGALIPEGAEVRFFRAPGGACSPGIQKAARNAGLSVLLWSVDPRDWATEDAHSVETAVVEQLRDGDVILLHDMSDSSVEAALSIVDKLQPQGFRFVTVSELAAAKGIPLTPGQVYSHFR